MKQGTNLHVITWSHTIGLRQVRFRSPTMLSIHLVIIIMIVLIVKELSNHYYPYMIIQWELVSNIHAHQPAAPFPIPEAES